MLASTLYSIGDRMINECGAADGKRIGTRRKLTAVPLCPPQIPHDLTWDTTLRMKLYLQNESHKTTPHIQARRAIIICEFQFTQLSPLQQKPNFNTKFCFHLIYITAAVNNNEISSLYFMHLPRMGVRGSGEIEFNVYSLHDVAVTYLFDIA
jgi:hypothetical protein